MATERHSSTPVVVVTQAPRWTVFTAGAVELDLQPDGRGCVAMLETTLDLNNAADLAELRDLAVLLGDSQVRAALGF